MPRRIISQDPVVIPSVPEKNLDSVVMASFRSRTGEDGNTRVRVQMAPQDSSTGEFGDGGFLIDLRDFDQQITQSPRLEAAWDTINDVMGLAYDFFRLREKVREGQAAGEDVSALITARNAALAALRAPIV